MYVWYSAQKVIRDTSASSRGESWKLPPRGAVRQHTKCLQSADLKLPGQEPQNKMHLPGAQPTCAHACVLWTISVGEGWGCVPESDASFCAVLVIRHTLAGMSVWAQNRMTAGYKRSHGNPSWVLQKTSRCQTQTEACDFQNLLCVGTTDLAFLFPHGKSFGVTVQKTTKWQCPPGRSGATLVGPLPPAFPAQGPDCPPC